MLWATSTDGRVRVGLALAIAIAAGAAMVGAPRGDGTTGAGTVLSAEKGAYYSDTSWDHDPVIGGDGTG